MRSFPRARDTGATAPRAPASSAEAGWLAPRRGHGAGGPRAESRGTALVRWAALALLLAVAGQAATPWPLTASARQAAMPPRCAAVPAALTDGVQAPRAAPARQDAEPLAPAGFGWG